MTNPCPHRRRCRTKAISGTVHRTIRHPIRLTTTADRTSSLLFLLTLVRPFFVRVLAFDLISIFVVHLRTKVLSMRVFKPPHLRLIFFYGSLFFHSFFLCISLCSSRISFFLSYLLLSSVSVCPGQHDDAIIMYLRAIQLGTWLCSS